MTPFPFFPMVDIILYTVSPHPEGFTCEKFRYSKGKSATILINVHHGRGRKVVSNFDFWPPPPPPCLSLWGPGPGHGESKKSHVAQLQIYLTVLLCQAGHIWYATWIYFTKFDSQDPHPYPQVLSSSLGHDPQVTEKKLRSDRLVLVLSRSEAYIYCNIHLSSIWYNFRKVRTKIYAFYCFRSNRPQQNFFAPSDHVRPMACPKSTTNCNNNSCILQ